MLFAIIFALTKLANVSLLVITMSDVFQLVIEMKLLVRKVSLTNSSAFLFFESPYEKLTVKVVLVISIVRMVASTVLILFAGRRKRF